MAKSNRIKRQEEVLKFFKNKCGKSNVILVELLCMFWKIIISASNCKRVLGAHVLQEVCCPGTRLC